MIRWKRPSRNVLVVVGITLLAFAIRVVWNVKVQNPLGAVFSDQAGYYNRACDFIDGVTHGDPRLYVLSPWGPHVLTALELFVFGRKSELGLAVGHAIVSTVPVVCTMLLTFRLTRSRGWMGFAGVVAACWQPAVSHGAYFMSENWYAAALCLWTVFLMRLLEGSRRPTLDALMSGVFLAIACVVRPQALLTFGLGGVLLAAFAWFRPGLARYRQRVGLKRWALLVAPLVVVLGISTVRMHRYAGYWGLVSENGPLNHVFGATHIARVDMSWTGSDGKHYTAWYATSAKYPPAPQDIVVVRGHVGDADVMNQVRREHEKLETTSQQLARAFWNVKLLAWQSPYPEQGVATDTKVPWRLSLHKVFRRIVINVLPVVLLGLGAMFFRRRQRLTGLVFAAHGVTSVIAAARYLGEGRMRIPYDAFLITAATVGLVYIVAFVRKRLPGSVRE